MAQPIQFVVSHLGPSRTCVRAVTTDPANTENICVHSHPDLSRGGKRCDECDVLTACGGITSVLGRKAFISLSQSNDAYTLTDKCK